MAGGAKIAAFTEKKEKKVPEATEKNTYFLAQVLILLSK